MTTAFLSDINATTSPRQVAPALHGEACHCKSGETDQKAAIQDEKKIYLISTIHIVSHSHSEA